MHFEQGDLTVVIVEANLTRDVEAFSKMDPFVRVEWVDQNGKNLSYETKQIDEAGAKPLWGNGVTDQNSFSLFVSDFQQEIFFDVRDGEYSGSRTIGSFTTDLSALCFNSQIDQWFDIFFGNIKAGELRLKTLYIDHELNQDKIQDQLTSMKDFIHQNEKIIGLEKNPKIENENELILIELDRAVKEGKAQISGPLGFKNEQLCNIVSQDKLKLCCKFDNDENQVSIEIKLEHPIFIRGYSFTTANDMPERDPKKWNLLLLETNIHTGEAVSNAFEIASDIEMSDEHHKTERFEKHKFLLCNPKWTNNIIFDVQEVYSGNVFQISNFSVYI